MKTTFLKLGLLLTISFAIIIFTSCSCDELNPTDNFVIRATNVYGNTNDIISVRIGIYSGFTGYVATITKTPFHNNGFTLQLPATISDNFLSPIIGNFPYNAIIRGNPNARWQQSIELVALNENGNGIGRIYLVGGIDIGNRFGTYARWLYVDSDFSVVGSGEFYGVRRVVNIDLKRGWNIVYETLSFDNDVFVHTMTSQRPSGMFFWTFSSWEDGFPF